MLSGGCEGCTAQSAPPFIFRGEGGEAALQKEEEVQGARCSSRCSARCSSTVQTVEIKVAAHWLEGDGVVQPSS